MNRLSGLIGSFAVALAALTSCGGNDLVLPSDGTPAELRVLRGDNQRGAAGDTLGTPLEVEVRDDQVYVEA